MRKVILVLFLSLLFVPATIAHSIEEQDSLVVLSDLKFESDYEEMQYRLLLSGGDNYFETLMSLNYSKGEKGVMMDKSMYLNELGKLKSIEKPVKKRGKYYKQIYNQVHERFLRKYELENYFNTVFSYGKYNCVSACALYALVFDALSIDYVIKETPTHVYLILEPNNERVLIETTDPVGGFNKFSQNFKSRFLKDLEQAKLISEAEMRGNNADDLFDTYYYNNTDDLNLKQLIGVQYWNDAIYQVKNKEYSRALMSAQKSYLLYPNSEVEAIMLAILSFESVNIEYKKLEDCNLLIQSSRFKEKEIGNKELVNEFLRLNNKVHIQEGNLKLFDEMYSMLMEGIDREELKEEIDFYYNYERARVLFNKGRVESALDFSQRAFELKERNADAESLFLASLGQVLEFQSDKKRVYTIMESMAANHPLLFENNKFGGAYLNYNLVRMADFYQKNQIKGGNNYKEKFEKIYNENPWYQVNKDLIGHAYSQLAVYYFKKGQYSLSRKIINKGLEFAPNNIELHNRKIALSY